MNYIQLFLLLVFLFFSNFIFGQKIKNETIDYFSVSAVYTNYFFMEYNSITNIVLYENFDPSSFGQKTTYTLKKGNRLVSLNLEIGGGRQIIKQSNNRERFNTNYVKVYPRFGMSLVNHLNKSSIDFGLGGIIRYGEFNRVGNTTTQILFFSGVSFWDIGPTLFLDSNFFLSKKLKIHIPLYCEYYLGQKIITLNVGVGLSFHL